MLPIDQQAQGDPETVICLPSGDTLIGLFIRGIDEALILGIREDRDGHPVSCAVVTDVSLSIDPSGAV